MTTETRAYQRGYAAGRKSLDDRVQTLLDLCIKYRARAERAESEQGYGRCDKCAYWTRPTLKHKWGWCGYTDKIEENDQPWRGDPDQNIATKENFGCIRFEPLEPPQ